MKIEREYVSRLWLLFWTFSKIAALVVGGGLAMLPVIEETFVDRKKIMTSEELLDMIAITQTVPGIIAVNSAVYVGWKVAGLAGAICAAVGVVTPSFIIILVIAVLFPDLSNIPGIGKVRARFLLKTFGSVEKIKTLSQEELASLPQIGNHLAKNLYQFFHQYSQE